MCSGMGGYSSLGLSIVLYSFSFVCVVHPVKRLSRVSVFRACLFLLFMCCEMPDRVIVSPSSVPLLSYSLFALFMVMGMQRGMCLDIGMSVNLSVLVLIFHLFSYVLIVSVAVSVFVLSHCLVLLGYVVICVMSSAYIK